MNVGNILKVADAIEASDRFDMCSWGDCIAGHARALATAEDRARSWWSRFSRPARDLDSLSAAAWRFLGLDELEAYELFIPCGQAALAMSATRQHAVRCLRNLAITGKVDWAAAMKPTPVLPPLPVAVPSSEAA